MFFFSYVPAAKEKVSPVPLSSSTTYYSTLKWYKDPFRSLTWCLSLFLSAKLHQLFFFFLRRDCKKTKRFEMLSNRRDLCLSLHSRRVRVYYCMYFTPFFFWTKRKHRQTMVGDDYSGETDGACEKKGKKKGKPFLFSFFILYLYRCKSQSQLARSYLEWKLARAFLFQFQENEISLSPPSFSTALVCVCTFKKKEKKSARELKPYLDGRIYTLYSTSWLCSQKWDFSSGVLFEIFSKFPAQSFLT